MVKYDLYEMIAIAFHMFIDQIWIGRYSLAFLVLLSIYSPNFDTLREPITNNTEVNV